MASCILCDSPNTSEYFQSAQHYFLICDHCTTVFRHPKTWASPSEEKERYLKHRNNIDDKGYQKFVEPLVELVVDNFPDTTEGLDFGAGTGPVAAELLKKKGFSIILYDPFFHPNKLALNQEYDFIICCEVIEHFHEPLKEFKLLKNLLKPNGKLFCKTNLWDGKPKDFASWWYKNDFTHTLFYNSTNLKFIQESCGFNTVSINMNVIEIY